jgi:Protein of unknown function (DUF3769)/LptA/(LptD N-terminal domain) LPS transport protein
MPYTPPPIAQAPAAEVRSQPVPADNLRQEAQTADALQPQDPEVPTGGIVMGDKVKLDADFQNYDEDKQVFTARGNVRMQFQDSVLTADELQVDLKTRIAVALSAPNKVKLERPDQRVEGSRLEYNFAKEEGVLFDAKGIVNLKADSPEAKQARIVGKPSIFDAATSGAPTTQRGGVIRYTARRIFFTPKGWRGEDTRFTNDPFDPPELEIKTSRAEVNNVADQTTKRKSDKSDNKPQQRLTTAPGTLVFDQSFALPLPPFKSTISDQDAFPFTVGYDAIDKGGLFYQQNLISEPDENTTLRISPQFFLQRALGLEDIGTGNSFNNVARQARPREQGSILNNFGVEGELNLRHEGGQRTNVLASFAGLGFEDLVRRIRARVEHQIPLGNGGDTLSFNYAYREQLFNGILGAQQVSQNVGVNFNSGPKALGDTGFGFNYAGGVNYIQAPSDRVGLTGPGPSNQNEASLVRYQLVANIGKEFTLYRPPQDTPATREFLRFTPSPITPGLKLITSVLLNGSLYSNGDSQGVVQGRVGIEGTVGQFAKDTLDYTNFNFAYFNGVIGGQSPFFFDRVVGVEGFSVGILQQIYGPVRAGVQFEFNRVAPGLCDTFQGARAAIGDFCEANRVYTLRYDRRTYGVSLNYNPVQQAGFFQLRLDDFNWGTAGSTPRNTAEVQTGVTTR